MKTFAPPIESSYALLESTLIGYAYQSSHQRWVPYPHLAYLAYALERLTRGEYRWLIVNMPPQHGKSQLCSRYFPAWYLEQHPDQTVLLCSYEATFARYWGREVRNLLMERGRVRLADDSQAADWWHIARYGGGMATAGAGGAITGKHADLLIIDDPHKNWQEAQSQTIREGVWDWFTSTAYTRLHEGGKLLLVQTRWHERDLTGRLLEYAQSLRVPYRHIRLPALAEKGDPLGRRVGEPLCSAFVSKAELQRRRTVMGERIFGSLYQQSPVPADGDLFCLQHFERRYTTPPANLRVILSVDTAYKTHGQSDYSVVDVWGTDDVDFYLLDSWQGRVPYHRLRSVVQEYAAKWRAVAVLIEDAAAGQSLLQDLKAHTRLPVVPFKPQGSKLARAELALAAFDAGKVLLPQSAPWLDAWIQQHLAFPNGAHDDHVDATSQALLHLMRRPLQVVSSDLWGR